MTRRWCTLQNDRRSADLDFSNAHIARVYDYWMGGKDNFAIDREVAQEIINLYPKIKSDVLAVRAFLGRAVTHLVGEVDIRQFLDIGTGLPTADNTHQIAQRVDDRCRVVYVDNDPIVLRHAQALLTGTVEGSVDYIDADLRDVEGILREAAETLDLSQPVGVMLLGILPMIPPADDPYGIVGRLMNGVAPGSALVISHVASDIHRQIVAESVAHINKLSIDQVTSRTLEEVTVFFDGLRILEPGITQVDRWRLVDADLDSNTPFHCGVAMKP